MSSRSAERAWVCQRSDRGQGADAVPQPGQVEAVEHRPLDRRQPRHRHPVGARPARRGRTRRAAAATPSPARRARSGTPAVSRDASTEWTMSAIRPTSAGSIDAGEHREPGLELGHGRGDVERRAAVAQQPQRRPLGHPPAVEEQVELDVERDLPGRGRRSRPSAAAKSSTSRATTHARVTSTTEAPVSSVMRWSNEIPDRLTISLTSRVAMISRRSGCWRMASA